MNDQDAIRRVEPASLIDARHMTHKAVQMLSNAARANLEAPADDSHANLGWNSGLAAFVSRPLAGKGGPVTVALSLARFELGLVANGETDAALPLDGVSIGDVEAWLDNRLADAGLENASTVSLPYEMPPETTTIETYSRDGLADGMTALSGWFATAAAALTGFSDRNSSLSPTPIRCWTHHYDIATEVNFQGSGSNDVTTIGLGFSPGDGHYDEPYFYVSPWSAIDQGELPAPSVLGHWHTDGFVGIVATASEVLTLDGLASALVEFLDEAFALCRVKLGV